MVRGWDDELADVLVGVLVVELALSSVGVWVDWSVPSMGGKKVDEMAENLVDVTVLKWGDEWADVSVDCK